MEFKVTYADGSKAEGITLIPSARRAIEAKYGKPFIDVVVGAMSDWSDEAVHTFLTLRRGESRTLDEWLATVDKIEASLDSPKARTSDPAPSTPDLSEQPSPPAKTSTT